MFFDILTASLNSIELTFAIPVETYTRVTAFEELNSNVTVDVLYASTDNVLSLTYTVFPGDEYVPPLHRIFRVDAPPFRRSIRPSASASVVHAVVVSL